MKIRDVIIAVLHRRGIVRMSKAAVCLVELVEVYLTDSADLLMSKMFRDAAQRHGIEKGMLLGSLRRLALRMGRKDPAWHAAAFPEGYSAPAFVRTVAREALDLRQAWGG